MGSPLSPILADIVMQDLETSILESLDFQVKFYFRYVDDIIMCAPKDKTYHIQEKFNSYHERLKFTTEFCINNEINFLDLNIVLQDGIILLDWFQKKSFSGRMLSYYSEHPFSQKIGTLYNLFDRAIFLSHPKFHQKNIYKCIDLLLSNGYPLKTIFHYLKKRITKHSLDFNNNHKITLDNQNNNTIANNIQYVGLPFIKMVTNKISNSLKKSDLKLDLKCINNLNRFIQIPKDKTRPLEKNNVIYKIQCIDCDASYVGQTKRQLKTRLKEHRNNIKLDPSRYSVVTEHMLQFNHKFDWDNVEILDVESNYHKRLVSEMLHIKSQNYSINLQKDSEHLNKIYLEIISLLAT